MSASALVTRTLWREIGSDLRGGAFKWWGRHEDALTGLTKAELLDMANHLRAGDRRGAKGALVSRFVAMGPQNPLWVAYRDGTTEQIDALARRRNLAIKAIGELGWWAARAVGKAILAAVVA